MRQKVIACAEVWFFGSVGEERRRLRLQIIKEMEEDPSWESGPSFDFKAYFEYQRQRTTMATNFNIAAYARLTGITVEIFKKGFGGVVTGGITIEGVRTDTKPKPKIPPKPLRVVFSGIHYDYLCDDAMDQGNISAPESKRRRLVGKAAASS